MSRRVPPVLMGRSIRCILFDLGHTLWAPTDKTTWTQLEQEGNQRVVSLLREHLGSHSSLALDDADLGHKVRKACSEHAYAVKNLKPEYEPDFALVTIEALQQIGIPRIDYEVAAAIFEAQRLRIPSSRPLFDDALSTLATLKQRGFLLGVVTNRAWGGQPFLEDLQTLGLLDYFDVEYLAISADLGVRKPHSAIFLHALNGLGVMPEEAAMVGDSLHADIYGAQQLNSFAIWKPRLSLRAEAAAAMHADSNEALLTYIHNKDKQRYQQSYQEFIPDLIIEHLSDLLDVFVEAGIQ